MRVVHAHLVRIVLAVVAGTAPTTTQLLAQAPQATRSAETAAVRKPTLAPADYARWESMGATEISRDGRWLAYVVSRVDGDGELRYREIARDSTVVVPLASRPVFSSDNRWLAYSIGLPDSERERRQRANQPTRSKVGIVDLRAGSTTVIDDVASFEFSADGRYLAMRGYAPNGRSSSGVDVVIRDLATGLNTSFGNVAEFSWQDDGPLLAMVIDAENRAGNGVRLYTPHTGVIRTLEADTARFKGLVWSKDGDDLAVLRVREDSTYEDPTHVILAWRNLATSRAQHAEFDPAMRTPDATASAGVAGATGTFPVEHRITDARSLRWSDDGARLFFGVQQWHRKPGAAKDTAAADTAAADSVPAPDSTADRGGGAARNGARSVSADTAGVEVWHAADVDIIPEQKVRANAERNRNHLAVWHVARDRFVQLGGDDMRDVSTPDGRYTLGMDGRPYDRDRMFGPAYRDLYAIDVETGERTRFAERIQFQYGVSPGGRYMIYVQGGDYWIHDAQTGRATNVTKDVPTSFVNLDNDHTIEEKPMYGIGGWTVGDRSVLLYDKYDIWDVRVDGSRAVNLTRGADERVRHRRVWLNPDERTVDLSKPVYVTLYGERTKKYGYGRLRSNAPVERLVFLDRNVTRLSRAKDADVYYYRVEGFDASPDYFVGGPRLADARQVTNTNAFQAEYAWGRSELIDFTSTTGHELQAALLYPAGYEPGRKYPMIVYFYEITSNTVHNYSVPSETSAYNPTVFTQNGYFVLRPDIVYRDRNPGVSAVEALVPAVQTVVDMGLVDPDRVGIVGHSWGAYQTTFAVTQTDMFRAAVAGAPLTNLISMYLSIYWNTGGTDARIFEISQGRMEVPFWQDAESYIANSPVFHIENMNTPLLVAFGTEDGAVEFNQGVELYNAARRAGKDMIMLVYEGENHSLAKKPNQLDYHRRIMQWFGHYLKDEPAPDWITQGVPHLARQRQLQEIRQGNGGAR
jgi:dipeptidyl aminopeptidase/acylaminoacyl peptidase